MFWEQTSHSGRCRSLEIHSPGEGSFALSTSAVRISEVFNRNMEKVLREEFVIRDFTRDFLFIQPGHIAVAGSVAAKGGAQAREAVPRATRPRQ